MGLRPGDLNQRVTIQIVTKTGDGAGGTTKTWTDLVTTWASVAPLNGGEAFRQGVINATQFYRIEMRFRTGVTPANRLVWKGVPLNIRTCADPDGTHEALLITAESGAAEP